MASWMWGLGNSSLARHSADGAATQNHRESNHGETGKGDPCWDWKAAVLARPNHGGFEAISR